MTLFSFVNDIVTTVTLLAVLLNAGGGGGGGTRKRQISLIFLPCLRQNSDF